MWIPRRSIEIQIWRATGGDSNGRSGSQPAEQGEGSGHLIQSVALDYHERADGKEKLFSIISAPQTTMSISNMKRRPNLNIQKKVHYLPEGVDGFFHE